MSEPQKYSLKKKTISVTISDEAGSDLQCELRELTGKDRNAYLNSQTKKVSQKDGSAHVKDFTGMCSDLLCRCLYGPNNEPFPAKVIDEWPSEMQMDLFLKAQELSGLTKKAEDEEKNS